MISAGYALKSNFQDWPLLRNLLRYDREILNFFGSSGVRSRNSTSRLIVSITSQYPGRARATFNARSRVGSGSPMGL